MPQEVPVWRHGVILSVRPTRRVTGSTTGVSTSGLDEDNGLTGVTGTV